MPAESLLLNCCAHVARQLEHVREIVQRKQLPGDAVHVARFGLGTLGVGLDVRGTGP